MAGPWMRRTRPRASSRLQARDIEEFTAFGERPRPTAALIAAYDMHPVAPAVVHLFLSAASSSHRCSADNLCDVTIVAISGHCVAKSQYRLAGLFGPFYWVFLPPRSTVLGKARRGLTTVFREAAAATEFTRGAPAGI